MEKIEQCRKILEEMADSYWNTLAWDGSTDIERLDEDMKRIKKILTEILNILSKLNK